jgi:23S rRNA (cytidine1920-2'-O)/16S rRNA (cytidine1409-2'-O)-methyltransferase
MSRRLRLDAELVRRGLARSRDQAAELIAAGRVAVGGQVAAKPASQVAVDAAITVEQASDGPEYVSRGGHKLAGALAAFGGIVAGSPTSCCGPAPRTSSRSTSGTASWRGRCRPMSG